MTAVRLTEHMLDLELLLGDQREQLISGLLDLQCALRSLAAGHEAVERCLVCRDVFDHLRLDGHRLLIGGHRRRQPGTGIGDVLVVGQRRIEARRVKRLILLIEQSDVELDVRRLPHQLVDLLDVLLEHRELGETDDAQILRLIDQALRLVLEHGDLVVDLLQRSRGGQDVLTVVGRVSTGATKLACPSSASVSKHWTSAKAKPLSLASSSRPCGPSSV